MFREIGLRVLAVDLDPQSNLTTAFLSEDRLIDLWPEGDHSETVLGDIQPLLDRLGDIMADPYVERIENRLWLLPGDLGLTTFEDRQALAWPMCLDDNIASAGDAFRVMTAYYRIMRRAAEANDIDIVLIDVGPNLGAINRAALVASDHVVIPLAADLFSLQGLRNLGPTLRGWREGWKKRLSGKVPKGLSVPSGEMQPVGYVILQHAVRLDRPTKAYEPWVKRIPEEYRAYILDRPTRQIRYKIPDPDPQLLATLKHYRSLMPLAQEVRKPMFFLKPADGAIGAHVRAVQDCYSDFEALARRIAAKSGVTVG
jgi:chromosome partitioning protein